MKKKPIYATRRIKELRTLAIESEFIDNLKSLQPQCVLLYVRDSTRSQTNNLQHQKSKLIADVEAMGFSVVKVFEEIAQGWLDDRTEFYRAVVTAKRLGLPLVAEAVNRFWRCRPFLGRMAPLRIFDIKRLMNAAEGVQLATLIPPGTPAKLVHAEQTKRGQCARGNYGGRPKESKKARRERLLPTVLELRRKLSIRKIAKEVNVPWSTVRDWIDDHKKTAQSTIIRQNTP